ncbi:hypothetical protein HK096_004574, partial [Nowakowskiella sp. JEL0078]
MSSSVKFVPTDFSDRKRSSIQSGNFENASNSDTNHFPPSASQIISLNDDREDDRLAPPRKKSLCSELSEAFSNLQTENLSLPVSLDLSLGTSSNSVFSSVVSSPISSPRGTRGSNFSFDVSEKEVNLLDQSQKDISLTPNDGFDQETNLNTGNKKRSRATPEQLSILETTFVSNPIPNGTLRRDISNKCGMTERSVQIWFQNRRARARINQRRMKETASNYQESAFFGSGSVINVPTQHPNLASSSLNQFEMQSKVVLHSGPQGFVNTNPGLIANGLTQMPVGNVKFTVSSLAVGSWSRTASVGRADDFLHCTANMLERCFVWMIVENGVGFRMTIPFFSISKIQLYALPDYGTDGGEAEIMFDLNCSPTFMMETDPRNGTQVRNWMQCTDFTEDSQGSVVFKHILRGKFSAFQSELVTCVRSEPSLSQIVIVHPPGQIPRQQLPPLLQQHQLHQQKLHQQTSLSGTPSSYGSPYSDLIHNIDDQQYVGFTATNSTKQSIEDLFFNDVDFQQNQQGQMTDTRTTISENLATNFAYIQPQNSSQITMPEYQQVSNMSHPIGLDSNLSVRPPLHDFAFSLFSKQSVSSVGSPLLTQPLTLSVS